MDLNGMADDFNDCRLEMGEKRESVQLNGRKTPRVLSHLSVKTNFSKNFTPVPCLQPSTLIRREEASDGNSINKLLPQRWKLELLRESYPPLIL